MTTPNHQLTAPLHRVTLPQPSLELGACALCGSPGERGITVPVFTESGQPGARRICQACLSAVLGVSLQLLGHAPAKAAAIAVEMHVNGYLT